MTDAHYAALRGLAIAIADFWLAHVPARFDNVFCLPNGRVRVIIEKYETPEDTQPVYGRRDEDDRMAD
jgi:hypothetical protein